MSGGDGCGVVECIGWQHPGRRRQSLPAVVAGGAVAAPFVGRWRAVWPAPSWPQPGRFGVAVVVPGLGGLVDAMISAPASAHTT